MKLYFCVKIFGVFNFHIFWKIKKMSPPSIVFNTIIPLQAKREREVANLTEKKSTYNRMWCQRIRLSVCDKHN